MDQGCALFREWLDGNEKAMDQIFELYHHSLILFINQYVHNLDTAEDLAAESFAKLILAPQKFNFSVSLKTYLFLIGKSLAKTHLRSRRAYNADLSDTLSAPSAETLLIEQDQRRLLYQALKTLPPNQQKALFLVYLEDLSVKEAAKVMKKTPKQVEGILYRGRLSLKKRYEVIQNEKQATI